MTKLSVIVPCYNCEDTLDAAVASVYQQAPEFAFDLTMVDDGSTDSTYAVMQRLADQYAHIRLVRHTSNLGGGAARNTGVAQSNGDLIFCLDSDDVLGPDFLRNMTRFWLKKKCDGVGMSTSVKFRGKNLHDVAYVTEFEGPGKKVRFESFFEGPGCSLSVVFMMRRAAFEAVGGYPTEHGFDTQGMALRFLCSGLSAYTCPDTVYFHRVEFHESYYLREYARGMLNWNWFSVLDEHLYVFSDKVKAEILASDLFAAPGKPAPRPVRSLLEGKRNIYAPNYRKLIALGRDGVARRLARSPDKFMQYWLGGYAFSKGSYSAAIDHFRNALRAGFNYRIIYHKMLLAALRLSGREISGTDSLRELLLYSQPYPEDELPLHHRIVLYALRNRLTRTPAGILNSQWVRLRQRWNRRAS
jgi:glycosyltransferase involved in cell wall biosynthesis